MELSGADLDNVAQTRATFVASRRPLVNEQLLDFLPERHTRC
jgi:hypothetical protein